jgi:hypothetical protein
MIHEKSQYIFWEGPWSNQTRTEIGKIIVLVYPDIDATNVVSIEKYRINEVSTSLLGPLLGPVFSLCRRVSRVKSWRYARHAKHLTTKAKMCDYTGGIEEIVLRIVLWCDSWTLDHACSPIRTPLRMCESEHLSTNSLFKQYPMLTHYIVSNLDWTTDFDRMRDGMEVARQCCHQVCWVFGCRVRGSLCWGLKRPINIALLFLVIGG